MKSYLTNLLPRVQQFSQTLDRKELLVDQPWVLIDDESNKQQYIFERNGNLIMSYNGKVQYGKWRYIAAAQSLVIDRETDSLLLNHAFVSKGACILKKDGYLDEPWILVNEKVVPDLDLERYLRSLLPEFKSMKELQLEGLTVYYTDNEGLIRPVIGTQLTNFKEEGGPINGTYKSNEGSYYFIENSIVKGVYVFELLQTPEGVMKVQHPPVTGIKKGDIVTKENKPVPDGDYTVIGNSEVKRITVRNGRVERVASNVLLAVGIVFVILALLLLFLLL